MTEKCGVAASVCEAFDDNWYERFQPRWIIPKDDDSQFKIQDERNIPLTTPSSYETDVYFLLGLFSLPTPNNANLIQVVVLHGL